MAAGFDPEFKAKGADAPFWLAAFEFEAVGGAVLRAVDEFKELAAVLFAGGGEAIRLLAFTF